MKKLIVFLCSMIVIFGLAGFSYAEVILFEDFEDSSGFTIGGEYSHYWGIAPLSGISTPYIPSFFVQGGSQSGNIFYGSYAKEFIGSPAYTMTINLPDLTGYTNLELTVSLAAPDGTRPEFGTRFETTHRDSLHIIGGTSSPSPIVDCTNAGCMPVTGAIDSFLPSVYGSPLRSQVWSIDLHYEFQNFTYTIDSSLKSITFAFASTDYDEVIGIDSVKITGDPVLIPVIIDIKPGSYPNSINLKSNGVVPVAILTTADFDASAFDPGTAKFADASPIRWKMEDVDGDGDMDMLLHFNTQDLNLNGDSKEATLTGKTTDGKDIEAKDSVNIVPKGKGKK
jgi:hypothetical protein